jgi:hypothetical protein
MTTKSRPLGVVAISVFFLGAAVFASITGLSLLLPNSILNLVWRVNESSLTQFESMGVLYSAALLLGVAVSTCIAGIALLKGRKVGWWLALIIFLIEGAGNKLQLLFVNGSVIGDWMGLSITFLLVFYLTRTKVRNYFHEPVRNQFLLKLLDNK